MFFDKYAEHLADSAPCASRWDGFDRGDVGAIENHADQGQRVIGRMTNKRGQRVVIVELWCDDDIAYEVLVDGEVIYADFAASDRERAIACARRMMGR